MKDSEIHVLLLPSWYPIDSNLVGGVFFQQQALALRRHGLRVAVAFPEWRSLREFSMAKLLKNHFHVSINDEYGLITYRMHGWNLAPYLRRISGPIQAVAFEWLVKKYIHDHGKPDLIHAHSLLWAGVGASYVFRRFNIPYVVTEHSSAFLRGLIKSWHKRYLQRAISDAYAVWAVGPGLRDRLVPYAPQDKEIGVVPNMVDVDFFVPPAEGRKCRGFRFSTIALMTPNKGLDILLRAFGTAFLHEKDVYLDIGGDGPQRRELEQLADRLGISDRVTFHGMLSQEGVRHLLWDSNVFVLPSYVETFGVVFLEAMSTGLPVIATRSGGPESFVDETVGILVDPGDVGALAAALRGIYETYSFYSSRWRDIRNRIVSNFSFEAVAGHLFTQYCLLLDKGRKL